MLVGTLDIGERFLVAREVFVRGCGGGVCMKPCGGGVCMKKVLILQSASA